MEETNKLDVGMSLHVRDNPRKKIWWTIAISAMKVSEDIGFLAFTVLLKIIVGNVNKRKH